MLLQDPSCRARARPQAQAAISCPRPPLRRSCPPMNETVAFTRMDQGTYEEYQLLDRLYRAHAGKLADEVLAMLLRLGGDPLGYRVTRLEHSLHTPTRPQRQRGGEAPVVLALLHDLGH